tara:strand:+ start:850 stop:1104 length:255 start_codon:yes stop_codon:yes gene_type:complete
LRHKTSKHAVVFSLPFALDFGLIFDDFNLRRFFGRVDSLRRFRTKFNTVSPYSYIPLPSRCLDLACGIEIDARVWLDSSPEFVA